jgi:MFS family permease
VFGTQAVVGSIIGSWFLKKRAMILGFVFAAPSLGSAVWQLISGFLITNWGFRVAYMIMGTSVITLSLLINLLFLRLPDQVGQKPLGWADAEEQKTATKTGSAGFAAHTGGFTLSEARKTLPYWLIFAGLIMSPMSVGGNNSNVATFLTGEGMSVLQASRYTSMIALFGGASTALSGFVSQKLGNKVYVYYIHIAFILGTAVLLLNTSLNPAILAFFVLLYALAAPTGASMSPTVNSQAFGDKDYSNILASMAPAGFLGSSVGPALTAAVLQTGGSLKAVYLFFACCNAAGLILLTSGLAAARRR